MPAAQRGLSIKTDAATPIDLPDCATLVDGSGGLPLLRVTTRLGTGKVFLHGAHVPHWVPAGHDSVIGMSAESDFAPAAAIRGGVPRHAAVAPSGAWPS